jgi:hypothetical protein
MPHKLGGEDDPRPDQGEPSEAERSKPGFDAKTWKRNYMRRYMRRFRERQKAAKEGPDGRA